jgi:hypothetical protein
VANLLDYVAIMLLGLIFLYGLSVAVFILLENCSPQLTLAWLFAFIFLPVIGVLIYIFLAEGFLFSGGDKLIKQELSDRLSQQRVPLLERQAEEIKNSNEPAHRFMAGWWR